MNRIIAMLVLTVSIITTGEELTFNTNTDTVSSACTVEVTMDESDWQSRGRGEATKRLIYTISLNNNSQAPLSNVRIEYRIYQQNNNGGREFISSDTDSITIEMIGPNATHTVPIQTSSFRRNSPVLLWEKVGIRARIYFPTGKGTEIMKEVQYPTTLSKTEFEWELPQISVVEDIDVSVYHTFTITNGMQITAQPLDFSSSNGSVKLQREDGKIQLIKIQSLLEKDQEYVKDWYLAYSLLSKNKLHIAIEKVEDDDQMYHGTLDEWDSMFPNMGYKDGWYSCFPGVIYDEISYELIVENKSGQTLDDITIQYCIYHQTKIEEEVSETELRDVGSDMAGWHLSGSVKKLAPRTVTNYIKGAFKIESIEDLSKENKLTSFVKLVEKSTEIKSKSISEKHINGARGTRNTRTIEGKLLGIRYRVYLSTPNGNWVMREFAEPKSLLNETIWPGE
jgi:hypothetical protein